MDVTEPAPPHDARVTTTSEDTDRRYFDAGRCPVCGASRTGEQCAGCGISYADPRVSALGQVLLRADAIRHELLRRPTSPQPGQPQPGLPQSATAPSRRVTGKRARTRKPPSVGWILLGVGALCLTVAAAVFVAVTWGSLGWPVRAVIMLLVTGVSGALSEVTRRKRLRASAETLTAVTGLLLLMTLIAGTRMFPWSPWAFPIVFTVLLGVSVVTDRWHARKRDSLWGVDNFAAVSWPLLFGSMSLAAVTGHALVYAGAVTAALAAHLWWFRGRMVVARFSVWGVGILAALMLTGQGLYGIARGPATAGWRVLFVLVVAALLVRLSPQRMVRRIAAAVAGALGSGILLALAARAPFGQLAWLSLPVLVVGLVAWLRARRGDELSVSLRYAGLGWLVPSGAFGVTLVLAAFGRMLVGPSSAGTGPFWMLSSVGVVGLALTAAVLRTRARATWTLHPGDAGILFSTWLVPFVLIYGTNRLAFAVLALALIGMLLHAHASRRSIPFWCGAALAGWLLLLASAGGRISPAALLVVGLAALTWGYGQRRWRLGAQVVGWLVLPLSLVMLHDTLVLLGLTPVRADAVRLLLVALFAAVVLATHQWWWLGGRDRSIVEIGALFWAGVSVLIGITLGRPTVVAACLAVVGVALVVAGLSRGRRGYRWAAIGVLTLANWTLLASRDVLVLEWWTLPTAAALLTVGIVVLRRNGTASSWRALLPGLVFGLVPSAIVALGDPVSWRALLVGLAAVTLILVGFFRHLAAPLVVGAVVLSALALAELWPLVAYVPRWALLAVIGALLVAIGVRWEARWHDLRRAGGYLRSLR